MYKNSSPSSIDQGVIIDSVYFYGLDQNHKGFVLTPACDFAQNKAELVQICALLPASFLVENLWARKSLPNIKSSIKSLIHQKFPRYHWFSPLPTALSGLVADFQIITSIPFVELENLPLIAELISPFREQIPARYSAYMGRVGTPDFNRNTIDEWTDLIVSELNLE